MFLLGGRSFCFIAFAVKPAELLLLLLLLLLHKCILKKQIFQFLLRSRGGKDLLFSKLRIGDKFIFIFPTRADGVQLISLLLALVARTPFGITTVDPSLPLRVFLCEFLHLLLYSFLVSF